MNGGSEYNNIYVIILQLVEKQHCLDIRIKCGGVLLKFYTDKKISNGNKNKAFK